MFLQDTSGRWFLSSVTNRPSEGGIVNSQDQRARRAMQAEQFPEMTAQVLEAETRHQVLRSHRSVLHLLTWDRHILFWTHLSSWMVWTITKEGRHCSRITTDQVRNSEIRVVIYDIYFRHAWRKQPEPSCRAYIHSSAAQSSTPSTPFVSKLERAI